MAEMRFSERDLGQLLWCISAVQQRWLRDLLRRIELDLAVSRSRQEPDGDEQDLRHDEWIGSRQVAAILRWDIRRVQRQAADLEARKVAGKLVFRNSTVRKYAEGTKGDG